jgi:hypothetical protein
MKNWFLNALQILLVVAGLLLAAGGSLWFLPSMIGSTLLELVAPQKPHSR